MPLACVGDSERQCMKDTYQKASYKHCYYDYDPYIYSQRGGEVVVVAASSYHITFPQHHLWLS